MTRPLLLAALPLLALQPARAAPPSGPGTDSCAAETSTLDIVSCTTAQTKRWDARLNTAYAALQRVIDPAQQDPLRTAQRLWIQYRDANCNFYYAQPGSISQIQTAQCQRDMTRARALELEEAARP